MVSCRFMLFFPVPPTGFEPVCAGFNDSPTGRQAAPFQVRLEKFPLAHSVPQWNEGEGKTDLEKNAPTYTDSEASMKS